MEYTLEEMLGFLSSHQAKSVKNILREVPELKPVMEQRLRAKLAALKLGDQEQVMAITKAEQQLHEDFNRETGVAAAKLSLNV